MVQPGPCYRLIYVSRVADWLEAEDYSAIYRISQMRNRSRGVTGLLMHDAKLFIQILEGPEQAVKTLFTKIAHDARHSDAHVVSAQHVEAPLFERWSMAGMELDSSRLAQVVGAMQRSNLPSNPLDFDPTDFRPPVLSTLSDMVTA